MAPFNRSLSHKNRTATINMTLLQFRIFTNYFWRRENLFHSQFNKLKSVKIDLEQAAWFP